MKDPVSIPTGVAIDFGGLAAKVVVLMEMMPAVSSRRESDYLSFHLGFLPSFLSAHFMTHPGYILTFPSPSFSSSLPVSMFLGISPSRMSMYGTSYKLMLIHLQ